MRAHTYILVSESWVVTAKGCVAIAIVAFLFVSNLAMRRNYARFFVQGTHNLKVHGARPQCTDLTIATVIHVRAPERTGRWALL